MQLTSSRNPLLQSIRRAAAMGRPTEDGLVVAEGPHLLEEACRGQWHVERIFVTAEARSRYQTLLQRAAAEIVEVSARAFGPTAATKTPQEVLALLRPRKWTWLELRREVPLIVVLDRVQDPGNAGAIVRSAHAFGATGIVFLEGSARIANGKLLRATAGSIFLMPFLEGVTVPELTHQIRSTDLKMYALTSMAAMTIREADLTSACVLVVGNEGAGVCKELLAEAQSLSIPTRGVESLNAAIACSIGLYAASERRRKR